MSLNTGAKLGNQAKQPASVEQADEFIGLTHEVARAWARRVKPDYRFVLHRLMQAIAPQPGDHVLDLGLVDATLALQLVSHIKPGQVTCLCPTEASIQQAYKQAQAVGLEEQIDWRLAPIAQLPFPNASFDLVTCSLSFRWLPANTLIREAYRLLVPGGRLVIAEFLIPLSRVTDWRLWVRSRFYKHLARNPLEAQATFYSADQLADLLRKVGFAPVVIQGLHKPKTKYSWTFSLIKAVK